MAKIRSHACWVGVAFTLLEPPVRALRPLPLAALLGSIALGGAAHAGAWTTAGMVGGGNSAQLLQSSGSALLSPTTATAPSGTTVSFNVSGGTGSYSWSMLANLSGGSIAPGDASDALYTAGPVNGIQDIIQVTDSSGATATATITVPGPTQHATCSATATVYTPAENTSGVVMFEDNWPANGDLDFNDQLIAYNYEFSLDSTGAYVQEMIANLSVLAVGAGIHNGISLHLPLPAGTAVTAIETIDSQNITLSPSANPNDIELIFPLIADTRSLFTRQDTWINTSTRFATQTGNSMTVTLTFTSPVQLDPSLAPYDLFIARTETPSHEIHLPQYSGTASMDTTLFNTSDDNSSTTGGLHFINENGLPFALTVPDVIAWPQETVAIDRVYENITAFGTSGGAYNLDWYASADATGLAFTAGLGGTLPPVPSPISESPAIGCAPGGARTAR